METILKELRESKLILPGSRVLAGVSGGADSMFMLVLLQRFQREQNFILEAAHVEHGIRGEESREDAEFVHQYCRAVGIPCHVRSCRVPEYAAQKGLGLEEAARILRYQILEELREECHADVIAVAHHEDDQAETVLWNLLRGSGLAGLCGMQKAQKTLIRPLLSVSKQTILRLVRQEEIPYREDRTNQDLNYSRNRIRNELFPYLETHLNAGSIRHIAQAAQCMNEIREYIDAQSREAEKDLVSLKEEGVCLSLDGFSDYPVLLRKELLRRCIEQIGQGQGLKDFGRIHLEQLLNLTERQSGKRLCLPHRITAIREENQIRFIQEKCRTDKVTENAEEEHTLMLNEEGEEVILWKKWRLTACILSAEEVKWQEIFQEKKYTKYLSCDTITKNVTLRSRRDGDYLVINARGEKKKLNKYLMDQKIPVRERDQIPVLAEGSHILWVIGCRISEDCKISDQTQKILCLHVREWESFSAGEADNETDGE